MLYQCILVWVFSKQNVSGLCLEKVFQLCLCAKVLITFVTMEEIQIKRKGNKTLKETTAWRKQTAGKSQLFVCR